MGVALSPPDAVPLKTLYVTPVVGLACHDKMTECIPVPERLIVAGEFVALLAILTLPLTDPPDVGANVTVSGTDCPGSRTVPPIGPLTVNPVPVTVTPEMVTLEFPLFVADAVSWLLL